MNYDVQYWNRFFTVLKKTRVKEIKFFFPIFHSWGKVSSEQMAMIFIAKEEGGTY